MPAGLQVGPYVIERRLGVGGMGEVYVGEHTMLGRRVAMKFLTARDPNDPQWAARFAAEARALARLRHRNVIEVYDFGTHEGRPYYVMELLHGCDFRRFLAADQRLSPEACWPYVSQICSALDAAHAAGIIHRDLKPENIFVIDDGEPSIKLLDFGVAHVSDPNAVHRTQHGEVLGTATHMAPEQILGQVDRIGPRTDVYSLGIVLFELLSGRLPFDGETSLRVMAMHLLEPAPSLAALEPDLPAGLSSLVDSCLAKQPEGRPANAGAVARAYAEAIGQPAPEPYPSSGRMRVAPAALEAPSAASKAIELAPVMAPPSLHPVVHVAEALPQQAPSIPPDFMSYGPDDLISPAEWGVPVQPPKQPGGPRIPGKLETLQLLLNKIKKDGDLPAFAANIGTISHKARPEGNASAADLAESILQDPSVTAKLLRYVNASFTNRRGGRVTTVSRAIVVLGFDRVRSMALSLQLFHQAKNRRKSRELSQSAVSSIVCGELARLLSVHSGLRDPEEAFLSASFRGLGRHLVLYYLPDQHDQICAKMSERRLREGRAALLVLGVSYEELGAEIASRWSLPDSIAAGMRPLPTRVETPRNDLERYHLTTSFAFELLQAVRGPAERREGAVELMRKRYQRGIQVPPRVMADLLHAAGTIFRDRYAKMFPVDSADNELVSGLRQFPAPGNSLPVAAKSARSPRAGLALDKAAELEARDIQRERARVGVTKNGGAASSTAAASGRGAGNSLRPSRAPALPRASRAPSLVPGPAPARISVPPVSLRPSRAPSLPRPSRLPPAAPGVVPVEPAPRPKASQRPRAGRSGSHHTMIAALDARLSVIARIRAQASDQQRAVRLILETFLLGLAYKRVLLLARQGDALVFTAGAGEGWEGAASLRVRLAELAPSDPMQRVLERGKTLQVEPDEGPSWVQKALGARRFHLFPVVSAGTVVALLYGDERNTTARLDSTEEGYIERLSNELGQVLLVASAEATLLTSEAG